MLTFHITLWYEISFSGTCIMNGYSWINTTVNVQSLYMDIV